MEDHIFMRDSFTEVCLEDARQPSQLRPIKPTTMYLKGIDAHV